MSFALFLEEFIVLRCRWFVAIPLLAFMVASARAQAPVELKWKFEKGKPFYQEMTTDTTQKMTVMGQNITQVQKVTFFLSWTPVDKDKDGNWTVKQKIEGLAMEIEIGGNKIPFDSRKDAGGTNPLSGRRRNQSPFRFLQSPGRLRVHADYR